MLLMYSNKFWFEKDSWGKFHTPLIQMNDQHCMSAQQVTRLFVMLVSGLDVILELTLRHDESVCDVCGVVNAESDGQHDVDAAQSVDGDVPEVEEANKVNQGQHNTRQNHQADDNV